MRFTRLSAQSSAVKPPSFFEWRRLPLLIFFLALLLRLVYLLQSLDNPLLYSNDLDEAYYIDLGHRIAAGFWAGENGPYFMDPLYGYFLALIFKLGGDNLTIVRILQILLDAGNTGLIFLIGERLWNRRAAAVAAGLYAAYAVAFYYSLLILKATLSVTGGLVFILLLLGAVKESRWAPWFRLGLFLGVLVFLHANWLLLAPLTIIFCLLLARPSWPVFFSRSLWLGAGLMLILSGGALRNYLVGGEWLFLNSQSGRLLYSSNNPENLTGAYGTPAFVRPRPQESESDFHRRAETQLGRTLSVREVSAYWTGETWRYIRQQPGLFLTGLANKAKWSLANHEIPVNNSFAVNAAFAGLLHLPLPNFLLAAALGLPGLAIGWRRRRETLWLLLPILTCAITMLVFYSSSRFRLPAVPFLLIGAGIYVDVLLDWWREKGQVKKLAGAALASLLLGGLILSIAPPVKNGFEELLLARAYWAIHDQEQAVATARLGAARFPAKADFPLLLGIIALVTNDPPAAITANLAAIKADPNNATAHHHLGVAYLLTRQPLPARASIKRAMELADDPKFVYNLAETYDATKDTGEAVKYYRQFLANDQADPALLNLARQRLAALAGAGAPLSSLPAITHRGME